jgi:hypothetical protein
MPKVSISSIENLQNESTAVAKINANFLAIQAVIDALLSRDGTAPNQMVSNLDMNNRRILNLPAPATDNEPARHGQLQQYVDEATEQADRAENEADRAEGEADNAAFSAAQALASLTDFLSRYIGAYPSDPSQTPTGGSLTEGAIYFNTAQDIFYVWTVVPVDDMVPEVVISSWEPLPVNSILSMSDIIHTWSNNQIPIWNTGQNRFIAIDLKAENIPLTPGILSSDNVQDALDEFVDRTMLGQYDINFYISGLMLGDEILFRLVAPRPFTIGADATSYIAEAGVPSVDETTLILRKNGTQFGTLTFNTGDPEGVFSIPGDTVFNTGDVFSITAPALPDTALADVAIVLTATR